MWVLPLAQAAHFAPGWFIAADAALHGSDAAGILFAAGNPSSALYDVLLGGALGGGIAVLADLSLVLSRGSESMDDILGGLSPGRTEPHLEASSEAELRDVWGRLRKGATRASGRQWPTYLRSDGVEIALRPWSDSGGATIDLKFPGSSDLTKVHIKK